MGALQSHGGDQSRLFRRNGALGSRHLDRGEVHMGVVWGPVRGSNRIGIKKMGQGGLVGEEEEEELLLKLSRILTSPQSEE